MGPGPRWAIGRLAGSPSIARGRNPRKLAGMKNQGIESQVHTPVWLSPQYGVYSVRRTHPVSTESDCQHLVSDLAHHKLLSR